jgi:hypothetical protein
VVDVGWVVGVGVAVGLGVPVGAGVVAGLLGDWLGDCVGRGLAVGEVPPQANAIRATATSADAPRELLMKPESICPLR